MARSAEKSSSSSCSCAPRQGEKGLCFLWKKPLPEHSEPHQRIPRALGIQTSAYVPPSLCLIAGLSWLSMRRDLASVLVFWRRSAGIALVSCFCFSFEISFRFVLLGPLPTAGFVPVASNSHLLPKPLRLAVWYQLPVSKQMAPCSPCSLSFNAWAQ